LAASNAISIVMGSIVWQIAIDNKNKTARQKHMGKSMSIIKINSPRLKKPATPENIEQACP